MMAPSHHQRPHTQATFYTCTHGWENPQAAATLRNFEKSSTCSKQTMRLTTPSPGTFTSGGTDGYSHIPPRESGPRPVPINVNGQLQQGPSANRCRSGSHLVHCAVFACDASLRGALTTTTLSTGPRQWVCRVISGSKRYELGTP